VIDILLHLAVLQRGGAWAGCGPSQSPPRYTKCNSTPINGQSTNFMLFDVALYSVKHVAQHVTDGTESAPRARTDEAEERFGADHR